MGMKTVIFGGTFNPVHMGHIAMIKAAMKKLKPDKLIMMPAHIPPHKRAQNLAPDSVRLEMCRIAAKDIPGVSVSDYELKAGGKSYTVNTLEYYRSKYPNEQLCFLMGSDMLESFLGWYKADRILELASLACVSRSREDSLRIQNSAERIRSAGGRVAIIESDPVDVSSTEARASFLAYGSSGGRVPKPIEKYILKNKLYNFDKSKYNKYTEFLSQRLSEKRFIHSLNVANESVMLAYLNGFDIDKAYFAGLMHDCCKELPRESQLELLKRSRYDVTDVELEAPKTHHGIAAEVYLREDFGVEDEEILSAVRYHTVAKGGMGMLDKIVYMADLTSAERDYPDVSVIRAATRRNIDAGLLEALRFSIRDSVSKSRAIPHLTFAAYNDAVKAVSSKKQGRM